MNTAQVITLQSAVVLRGQRAWGRIKATAPEQRQLWREVGEALAYGKATHPSTKAFGAWIVKEGFDDIGAKTRTDAIWLSQNWALIGSDFRSEVTHPVNLREAFRDLEAAKDDPFTSASDTSILSEADAQYLKDLAATAKVAEKVPR